MKTRDGVAYNDVKLDNNALFKLSYGLYVLTAKDEKYNGTPAGVA